MRTPRRNRLSSLTRENVIGSTGQTPTHECVRRRTDRRESVKKKEMEHDKPAAKPAAKPHNTSRTQEKKRRKLDDDEEAVGNASALAQKTAGSPAGGDTGLPEPAAGTRNRAPKAGPAPEAVGNASALAQKKAGSPDGADTGLQEPAAGTPNMAPKAGPAPEGGVGAAAGSMVPTNGLDAASAIGPSKRELFAWLCSETGGNLTLATAKLFENVTAEVFCKLTKEQLLAVSKDAGMLQQQMLLVAAKACKQARKAGTAKAGTAKSTSNAKTNPSSACEYTATEALDDWKPDNMVGTLSQSNQKTTGGHDQFMLTTGVGDKTTFQFRWYAI